MEGPRHSRSSKDSVKQSLLLFHGQNCFVETHENQTGIMCNN